jgi:hypothetical protein
LDDDGVRPFGVHCLERAFKLLSIVDHDRLDSHSSGGAGAKDLLNEWL